MLSKVLRRGVMRDDRSFSNCLRTAVRRGWLDGAAPAVSGKLSSCVLYPSRIKSANSTSCWNSCPRTLSSSAIGKPLSMVTLKKMFSNYLRLLKGWFPLKKYWNRRLLFQVIANRLCKLKVVTHQTKYRYGETLELRTKKD